MELRKCPVCGEKLRSEALGWICYNCQGFIDMQGVFHEHKEKSFMPPQTNADRIRDMNDEELAEFLYDCEFLHICKEGCGECHYNGECEKRIAEWLKQPAEGE